jgi:hypothetical protein
VDRAEEYVDFSKPQTDLHVMMTPLRSNFTKTGELFDKIKQKYMLI